MNQSASAQNLVGSQKNLTSSLPMSETPNQDARRNPIDVYTARRRSVRRQKHELVESKLSQFPTGFLIFHCFVLVGIAALYFAVQIALLVRQSPLSIICTGFWMALLYLACIYTVFLLVRDQTYKSLMISMVLQGIGLVMTLIGTILINCADAALFSEACIPKCLNEFSYQYLNILMIIAGVLAFVEFCLYFVLIEIFVLKEVRNLNTFLGNRK